MRRPGSPVHLRKKSPAAAAATVHLSAVLTEIGTLELACRLTSSWLHPATSATLDTTFEASSSALDTASWALLYPGAEEVLAEAKKVASGD